jgi:hypothetical protein
MQIVPKRVCDEAHQRFAEEQCERDNVEDESADSAPVRV